MTFFPNVFFSFQLWIVANFEKYKRIVTFRYAMTVHQKREGQSWSKKITDIPNIWSWNKNIIVCLDIYYVIVTGFHRMLQIIIQWAKGNSKWCGASILWGSKVHQSSVWKIDINCTMKSLKFMQYKIRVVVFAYVFQQQIWIWKTSFFKNNYSALLFHWLDLHPFNSNQLC